MKAEDYVMREFNVVVWYSPENVYKDEDDFADGDYSLGCADESYEIATLDEAMEKYHSITKCFHKMLLHYPNYNLCEYGGDGNVLIEGSGEESWVMLPIEEE